MKTTEIRDAWQLATYDPHDSATALRTFVDTCALPAAVVAGLFPPEATIDSISRDHQHFLNGDVLFADWVGPPSTSQLKTHFGVTVALLDAADDAVAAIGRDALPMLSKLRYMILYFVGYFEGMCAVRKEHTDPASDRRRRLGQKSRERVRREALNYVGKLSRERAATLIASRAALEPATVRRMLSALFPGDSWTVPIDDSSGHDDEAVR